MNSNRLMQFKTIAECENISKAVKKMYISALSLSKSLSKLEEELNCPLFDRAGKKLYINNNGKNY